MNLTKQVGVSTSGHAYVPDGFVFSWMLGCFVRWASFFCGNLAAITGFFRKKEKKGKKGSRFRGWLVDREYLREIQEDIATKQRGIDIVWEFSTRVPFFRFLYGRQSVHA